MRGYNFSNEVANLLRAARAEATRLGSGYVSPEVLLLGMLAEDGTLAARALTNLGMTREVVTQLAEQQIARLPRSEARTSGMMPYTSAAKRALEGAMDEASEVNYRYVDTEHVLLGILRDPQSDTVKMLAEHDVTVDRVRTELERLRSSSH